MQESHHLIQRIARRFSSPNPTQRAARRMRVASKRDRAAAAPMREKPEKRAVRAPGWDSPCLTAIKGWHGDCDEADEKNRIIAMRTLTVITAIALAANFATAAHAQVWTNSGAYNGYGAMNQNTPANYNLRDQNGNLTMVDGQITSANFGMNQGGQSASAGVGTSGAGAAYGQAMAVGNQLNVTTIGFNNTVIVDSRQTNTGNQTAVVDLNNH